ncbi:hypothetical protein BHE74_00048330 [Ensete ventricosum]|nr:hypothetical protein BHE74_00048330 [Ensete ventricosum]
MQWDLAGSPLGDSLKGSGSLLGTRREIVGKKTRGLTVRMSEATGLYGKNPAGKSPVSGGWTAHTTEFGWRLVAFDGDKLFLKCHIQLNQLWVLMLCSLISGNFHDFIEKRTMMLKVFLDDDVGSMAHDCKKE